MAYIIGHISKKKNMKIIKSAYGIKVLALQYLAVNENFNCIVSAVEESVVEDTVLEESQLTQPSHI